MELKHKAEWYAGLWRTEEIALAASPFGLIYRPIALAASPFGLIYRPTGKIPVIVVDSFPALGKLAAVRFIEWVQDNPGGVISLPTGKTPEYFIKWIKHFLGGWDDKSVRTELEEAGIDPSQEPDIKSLRFVQIDEFYPIDSSQLNSFYYYVNHFYIEGFGLDRSKAMLIDASRVGLSRGQTINDVWPDNHVDLSLRYRHAKNHLEEKQKFVLERIDQWCMEYEDQIRKMGGIGFFLGGIGPDGHIGFNISGSDHNSTTRLCPTNYETQAAAAVDLGGIETARKRLVITIGLRTITQNKNCTAIVIAAGALQKRFSPTRMLMLPPPSCKNYRTHVSTSLVGLQSSWHNAGYKLLNHLMFCATKM